MFDNTASRHTVIDAGSPVATPPAAPLEHVPDAPVDRVQATRPTEPARSAAPSRPAMPDLQAIDRAMRVNGARVAAKPTTNLRGYMNDPTTPLEAMHTTYQRILELANRGLKDSEIGRLLGCAPSHAWQVRHSPAGQRVLREAAMEAMPVMKRVRLEMARSAHRAALLIHDILTRGEELGYTAKERLEVAKYAVECAGLGPQKGKNQEASGVQLPVPGDLARMRLMMEMNRAECAQSENRGRV